MPPIVSVRNLGYAYPAVQPDLPPQWVLRGLNLEVQPGEFVAIMGRTGAGKSTLCLALNGIVPQSTGGVIRGEVIVDGLNTKTTPVADLAQRVGLVFQDPETQFLNMDVEAEVAFGLENLGVAPALMAERVDWALAQVGMSAHKGRSPFRLSGGQKQRVALAAVLAMLPKVLVLDEPTASLDPAGKLEVLSVVRALARERAAAIIMVENDADYVAEFADRVIVLRDGAAALDGPPAEIFQRPEALREFGLNVPQVSEVAQCLNRRLDARFAFTRLEEAYNALSQSLAHA